MPTAARKASRAESRRDGYNKEPHAEKKTHCYLFRAQGPDIIIIITCLACDTAQGLGLRGFGF